MVFKPMKHFSIAGILFLFKTYIFRVIYLAGKLQVGTSKRFFICETSFRKIKTMTVYFPLFFHIFGHLWALPSPNLVTFLIFHKNNLLMCILFKIMIGFISTKTFFSTMTYLKFPWKVFITYCCKYYYCPSTIYNIT